MALATQCPHCHTTFRVAADQLKLRGGIVRCGACHEVFDGNAGLIAAEAAAAAEAQAGAEASAAVDLPEPPSAPVIDHPETPPAPAEPSASAAFDAEMEIIEAKVAEAESAALAAGPVYKLDFDTTFDPFGIMPKAALPEPVPEPATPPGLDLDQNVDDAPAPAPTPQAADTSATPFAERAHEGTDPGGSVPDGHIADIDSATSAAAYGGSAHEGTDPPGSVPVDNDATPSSDIEDISALPPPRDDLGTDPEGSIPAASPTSPPSIEHAPDPAAQAASRHDTDTVPSNSMLLRAPSAPGHDSAPEPAPAPPASARAARVARVASARAIARAREAPSSALVVIPKAPAPDPDEPEFVRRSRLADETGRTRRMLLAAAAVVLALLLLVQTTLTFHNQLAAQLPALKPALQAACGPLGCRIDLPAQLDQLTIEPGELQKLGPTTYSLSTLLRNQGGVVQAWPHIELTLNDDAGKPVLRRVITPADYLPAASVPARGFPARAEQPVMLYFDTSQLTADGYHLDIFYP